MKNIFVLTHDVEIHPIAHIFPPMNDAEFEEFKEDLLGNGLLEPIVLFEDMVLDGRNRYNACKEIGIDIYAVKWEGGMDPVEYVVSKNIHRRQLTPAQRAVAAAKAIGYHAEQAKKRQQAAGGDRKSEEYQKSVPAPGQEAVNTTRGESTEQAGKIFDVSGRSVARAMYILDYGTEEEKKEIETGKTATKPLEKKVRERIKNAPKTKSTFNQTTDSIEWAKWTWNPVTGCLHGCSYCYARDMTKRYPDAFPHGFKPHFHPERLDAPKNTKPPANGGQGSRSVFVCSMADLFGEWVEQKWIDEIVQACANAPEWIFIFLTKNPSRLVNIKWPENAWVGTTVDCQDRVAPAVAAFAKLSVSDHRPSTLFLSCEPLLEPLDFGDDGLKPFDWVIIGGCSASSGRPASQPDFKWVWDLSKQVETQIGYVFYWKPNLQCRPMNYPKAK